MSCSRCVKTRYSKSRVAYYSNSIASFRLLLIAGDIHPQPGPLANHHRKPRVLTRNALLMGMANVRSLRNKTSDFVDYVCSTNVDIFAITETWLNVNDDTTRCAACPEGYYLADHPRSTGRGGGTALLYRDSLAVKKIEAGEKTSFENSEWLVQSKHHNLRIVIIYRPPYSEEHKVTIGIFLNEFLEYLKTLLLSNEEIIILGDFNIHVDNSNDNDASKLMDIIESLGLKLHVEEPTHIFGHTLDLVITRLSDDVIRDSPHVDSYIADHGVVLFKLNSVKPSLSVKTVSYRKYKAINIQDFKSVVDQDSCGKTSCSVV